MWSFTVVLVAEGDTERQKWVRRETDRLPSDQAETVVVWVALLPFASVTVMVTS